MGVGRGIASAGVVSPRVAKPLTKRFVAEKSLVGTQRLDDYSGDAPQTTPVPLRGTFREFPESRLKNVHSLNFAPSRESREIKLD